MNPQDLITQVRAPGEEDDTHTKPKPVNTGNTTNTKAGGGGGCCCSKPEDDGHQGNANAPKAKLSISVQNANSKFPDRATINSPRGDASLTGSQKAPWREDHLLPPPRDNKKGMKCLVLDLDETLVHSSFKPVDPCDFIIPVEIEDHVHQVYVCKRPHVDEFMKRCGEILRSRYFHR